MAEKYPDKLAVNLMRAREKDLQIYVDLTFHG
jgi:hypothetical protein